ncbi:MAG: gamma-glutamylcyclotransferase family protein [Hyphomicrobiaceae bacterium]
MTAKSLRRSMACYLFVYGTLMSSAAETLGRVQRARLRREGRSLGPATTTGRLYDLGRYPGLIERAQPGDVVHGEVYALDDDSASLGWLDAYEGIVPGRPSDYTRTERAVRLASGETVTAWMYVATRDVSRARHIRSGRWEAR